MIGGLARATADAPGQDVGKAVARDGGRIDRIIDFIGFDGRRLALSHQSRK